MKDWMQRAKIRQGEVARATRRSREHINRLANGKEQPSAVFIMDFFFAFGEEATCQAFDEQPQ